MGDFAIGRQFGSKSICWEELVAVIVLNDLSNCLQCHSVGVHLIWTHVMQGGWLSRVT